MFRFGLSVALTMILGASTGMARDEIELPPIERQVCSPDGRICAVIQRPDELRVDMMPVMTIQRTSKDIAVRELNYPIGPRFFLSFDDGRVVLMDEWLRRVDTEHAIEVVGPDGSLLAQWSTKDVLDVAGETEGRVKEASRFGPWLATEPSLDGQVVRFKIGKTELVLNLSQDEVHLSRTSE